MISINKKEKQELKYKAIYKNLYNYKIKVKAIADPGDAISFWLQENEKNSKTYEMYMLTCVTPLTEEEKRRIKD